MTLFEIRNGSDAEAPLIGRVFAAHEVEAVGILEDYKNGLRINNPGSGTASVYVEWAHPGLEKIHPLQVPFWCAKQAELRP